MNKYYKIEWKHYGPIQGFYCKTSYIMFNEIGTGLMAIDITFNNNRTILKGKRIRTLQNIKQCAKFIAPVVESITEISKEEFFIQRI